MNNTATVDIGIDLGTTNSVVAYSADGRTADVLGRNDHQGLFPSVLSYGPTGLLVGRRALNNRRAAPESTVLCVKRLMGRDFSENVVTEAVKRYSYDIRSSANTGMVLKVGTREMTPSEVSAEYLSALKQRAEVELARTVRGAVITVPAYFEERQRAATREAGELAGLFVKKIIDEPTAAAIAFGMDGLEKKETLMVFDLGGGTFDISLMHAAPGRKSGNPQIEVFEVHGDNWLGGSDMDERLYQHVVEWFRNEYAIDPDDQATFRASVRSEVEAIKIRLSTEEVVPCIIPAAYRHSDEPKDVRLEITRAQYDALIRRDLDRIRETVEQALRQASRSARDISRVLLVGGASQTPAVRRQLADLFGDEKLCTHNPVTGKLIDPMSIVAQGAAVYARNMQGIECPNEQCGEQQTIERKNGQSVQVILRTVNEETRTTCEECGTSLAAGRARMGGLSVTDKTASVLGIIAVRGSEHNAFVPLIEKGTTYPLRRPVVHRFFPYAERTQRITFAVYEALDNLGNGRWEQGQLDFELEHEITRRDEVVVSFNLDRNREVTLEIAIPSRKLGPQSKRLTTDKQPTNQPNARLAEDTWEDQLDNLVRHLRKMCESYGEHVEPVGLQMERIDRDLSEAGAVLNSDTDKTPEVTRLMGRLDLYLRQSGPASTLYFAQLMHDGSGDQKCKNSIHEAKQEYVHALNSRQAERIKAAGDKLNTAVAQAVPAGSGTTVEVLNIDPNRLVTTD